MPQVTILNEHDLRQVVKLDLDTISHIESCFETLNTREVVMPPILRLDIHEHNGEVDVKTAYLPGLDSFAIKVSPGFFDNPKIGLPSVSGMMILLSAKTGMLENVLLDNGYLTDIRTAAAGAVSVKHLSRLESNCIGIIGAGTQAFLQLKACAQVRDLQSVTLWARDTDKAHALATRIANDPDLQALQCTVVNSIEDLATNSDIIITTTPSTTPLLLAQHLKAGVHITAMGSDAEHKNEIDAKVFALDNMLYVCDRLSQVRVLGELHHAINSGIVAPDTPFTELGEVISGQKAGRINNQQITLCDLTGTGAQDTAIATVARARALQNRAGVLFES